MEDSESSKDGTNAPDITLIPARLLSELKPDHRIIANLARKLLTIRIVTEHAFPTATTLKQWAQMAFYAAKKEVEEWKRREIAGK